MQKRTILLVFIVIHKQIEIFTFKLNNENWNENKDNSKESSVFNKMEFTSEKEITSAEQRLKATFSLEHTKEYVQFSYFDEVTGNFEIDFGDKEIQYSPTITFTMGKITGTYNKQQNKLTNVNGSGSVKQYVSSNLTMYSLI